MKKTLDTKRIASELAGTAFFQDRRPATASPGGSAGADSHKANPFAGHNPSEQVVPPGPTDQRPSIGGKPQSLPTSSSDGQGTLEPRNQDSLLIGKEGSREVGKEASLPGNRPESREVGKLFDLSDKPSRKDSFLFTDDEFEIMDDIKLDLRRTYDLKVTKNDLARCGLGYLIDDYKHRGEASELVRKLRHKRVNQ